MNVTRPPTPVVTGQVLTPQSSATSPYGPRLRSAGTQNTTTDANQGSPNAPRRTIATPPPQVTPAEFQAAFRGMNQNLDDLNKQFNETLIAFDKNTTHMHQQLESKLQVSVTDVAKASHAHSLAPKTYTGHKFENVTSFVNYFKRYCLLSKFNNEESITMLSVYLQGPALIWYESKYGSPDTHTTVNVASILKELETKFGPSNLTFMDVETLLDRPQRPDEGFESFLADILERFALCSLPQQDEFKYFFKNTLPQYRRTLLAKDIRTVPRAAEAIRREIQIRSMTGGLGESNQALATKLDDLQSTLNNLTSTIPKQIASMTAAIEEDKPAEHSRKYKQPPSPCPRCQGDHWLSHCNVPKGQNQNKSQQKPTCSYCGKTGHNYEKCYARLNSEKNKPANDKAPQCNFCGLFGHVYDKCRKRQQTASNVHDAVASTLQCPYCGVFGHAMLLCGLRQAHINGPSNTNNAQLGQMTSPPTMTSANTPNQ